jgi:CheY-like chemotaxis protein
MNVLIVDDDALICHVYSTYLKNKNNIVYEAENGKVALELINLHPEITKVVLDVHMPEMDAFQFLKHIHKDNSHPKRQLDVYFVSNFDKGYILSKLTIEKIDKGNIKAFFKKPIDLGELHTAMQNHKG